MSFSPIAPIQTPPKRESFNLGQQLSRAWGIAFNAIIPLLVFSGLKTATAQQTASTDNKGLVPYQPYQVADYNAGSLRDPVLLEPRPRYFNAPPAIPQKYLRQEPAQRKMQEITAATAITGAEESIQYSQLSLSPSVDIKAAAIGDGVIVFQDIERTTISNINYYNMKVCFYDTVTKTSQTIACPTSNSLRVNSGILPKPEVLDDGSIVVGWSTSGGASIAHFAKDKDGVWSMKCQTHFEESIPETRQPVLKATEEGFASYTGKDSHTLDNVMFRYFNKNCTQLLGPTALGTDRSGLKEFYVTRLNDTHALDARFSDTTREIVNIDPLTGTIISRRSDSDGIVSEPIELPEKGLTVIRPAGIGLEEIHTEFMGSSQTRTVIDPRVTLTIESLDRGYGITNGPNNTKIAWVYDGTDVQGQLIDESGKAYGQAFTLKNIQQRPRYDASSPILLPIDIIPMDDKFIISHYTDTGVVLTNAETGEVIASPTPTPKPTPSPSESEGPPNGDNPGGSKGLSPGTIAAIVVPTVTLTALVALACFVRHCKQKIQTDSKPSPIKDEKHRSKKVIPSEEYESKPQQPRILNTSDIELGTVHTGPQPSAPPAYDPYYEPRPATNPGWSGIMFDHERKVEIAPATQKLSIKRTESTTIHGTSIIETITSDGEPYDCPMTLSKPDDPYVTVRKDARGYITYIGVPYERSYIENWVIRDKHAVDPTTNIPINGVERAIDVLNAYARFSAGV